MSGRVRDKVRVKRVLIAIDFSSALAVHGRYWVYNRTLVSPGKKEKSEGPGWGEVAERATEGGGLFSVGSVCRDEYS